jgi:hypothetical protein
MNLVRALLCFIFLMPTAAQAAPRLERWPLTGIAFDDPPKLLPVTVGFLQALDKIAAEFGATCRDYEVFAWALQATEQARVNRIFSNTTAALTRAGYALQPLQPQNASADVTVFGASRNGQKLLALWSAGPSGLLLMSCETQAPTIPAKAETEKKKSKPKTKPKSKPKAKSKTAPQAETSVTTPNAMSAETAPPLPAVASDQPVSAETDVKIAPPPPSDLPLEQQPLASPRHSLSKQEFAPDVKAMLEANPPPADAPAPVMMAPPTLPPLKSLELPAP